MYSACCAPSYFLQPAFQEKPNGFSKETIKVKLLKEHIDAEEQALAATQPYTLRALRLKTWSNREETLKGSDKMDNNFGSQLHGRWPRGPGSCVSTSVTGIAARRKRFSPVLLTRPLL